jgi:hypothetical protein
LTTDLTPLISITMHTSRARFLDTYSYHKYILYIHVSAVKLTTADGGYERYTKGHTTIYKTYT